MGLENGDIICFGCAKGFRIRPGKEIDKKSSDLKYMVVIEDKFPCGQTDEEMKMRFDQLVKSTSDIKERIDTLENLTKKLTTFCL
nr:hypothetical transcript [Hymenolepis microstoma]